MPRLRVWGLSVVLAASGAAGTAATAAEPLAKPLEQTTLMNKLSSVFSPKKPKSSAPAEPITITAPLTPEAKLEALRAEQDAYLRRVSVCTELRRIAMERGDAALGRQADELERQAEALYNARTAGLGIARVKAPLPESTTITSLTDFPPATPPTTSARADRLIAPAAPVPASTTAQVREVAP